MLDRLCWGADVDGHHGDCRASAIAIDGKSLRGGTGSDGVMPRLAAAYDHAAGAVLGQVAVTAKSNEIPAVRDLLTCFDLADVVITRGCDAHRGCHTTPLNLLLTW